MQIKTITRKCFLKNVSTLRKKKMIRNITDDLDISSGDPDNKYINRFMFKAKSIS